VKIVATIARVLMGVVFLIFGANQLVPFLPTPPMPAGAMKDFATLLGSTHYSMVVGFFQLVPGILLLINRYVPLALTVLAAELVNILTFHALVAHSGLFPVPVLVVVLWIIVFWRVRTSFAGILAPTRQE
jgi:putative oxidoreductase